MIATLGSILKVIDDIRNRRAEDYGKQTGQQNPQDPKTQRQELIMSLFYEEYMTYNQQLTKNINKAPLLIETLF